MMISKLREHFPARLPEWWNAGTLFAWGAYILLHPGVFAHDAVYSGLIEMGGGSAPLAERTWGLITVVVGLVRAGALFINGAYYRTPLIRLIASMASAFVWWQVVNGLLLLGRPSTGIVVYSAAVVLDLISAYRASCDTVIAQGAHNAQKLGVVDGDKSGTSRALSTS